MNKKKQDYLFKRFSKYFPPKELRTSNRTCMAWGFAVSDGWYKLVKNLLLDIEKLDKENPDQFLTFQVEQVKEKFGGLRFYHERYVSKIDFKKDMKYYLENDPLEKLVMKAERDSFKTCEDCGKKGKLREDRMWIRTLCENCSKKDIERTKIPNLRFKQLREKMH